MAQGSQIKAGSAFVELYLKDGRLTKGLDAASRRMRAFGGTVSSIGKSMAGLGLGALGGLGAAVKMATSMGSALVDASERTGIAVESLSELGYAAEQSGSSMEELGVGIKAMQKMLADAQQGGKGSAETLGELGLSIEQLAGLNPEQQFLAIADALAKIPDPTMRAAMAQKALGKSAVGLLPLLNGGAAGIDALRDKAKALGLTVSTEAAQGLEKLGDKFDDLVSVAKAGVFAIGSALAPALSDLVEKITRVAVAAVNWVKENKGVVVAIAALAAGLATAGAALVAIGGAISAAGAALGGLSSALGLLGSVTAKLLSPFSLVARSIGSIGKSLSSSLMGAVKVAASGFGLLSSAAMRSVSTVLSGALRIGTAVGSFIVGGVSRAGQALASLAPRLARLPAAVATAFNAARGPVTAFASGVVTELRYAIGRPVAYARALLPGMSAAFSVTAAKVSAVWNSTSAGIIARASAAFSSLRGAGGAAVSGLAGRFGSLGPAAASAFNQVRGLATGILRPLQAAIAGASFAPLGAAAERGMRIVRVVFKRSFPELTGIASAVSTAFSVQFGKLASVVSPVVAQIGAKLRPIGDAIKGAFSRVVPLIQADFNRIVSIAKSVGSGVVSAWRSVGPRLAAGITTALRGAFANVRSMAASAGASVGRGIGGIGRGMSGALGGLGMLASLAGDAAGPMGALVSTMASAVPAIGAIGAGLLSLLSPFGLAAAAIGGGIYLWGKYSESGKTAFAAIGVALAPLGETIKSTFGGVAKALAAGDLVAAGKIAMAGLKLTLLQGVSAISKAVGGSFGQFLGTITQQLLSGDLRGAWSTVVKSMAALWDQLLSGMTTALTKAASIIKNIWLTATRFISDKLLELAKKYPTISKGLLGVDLSEQQGKGEADKAGKIKAATSNLEQARKALERAEASGGKSTLKEGDSNGLQYSVEELRNLIQNYEKDLEKWGATQVNVLGDAQAAAGEQLQSTADGLQATLDELDAAAAEKAAKSAEQLGAKGVTGLDDSDIKDAQAELDEALKSLADAQQETAKQAQQAAAGLAAAGTASQRFADSVQGTFSANAAARLAPGLDWAKKTAAATAATAGGVKAANKLLEDIKKNGGKMAISGM